MNYSRQQSNMSATAGGGWSQNISGPVPKPRLRRILNLRRTLARAKLWTEENWRRAWVVLLWAATMAALFAWKFTQYRQRAAWQVMGYCLPTAKGAAETLKLNMALVLLPVCRNTLTWLRSTRARLFVAFDDNINFHKVLLKFIFFRFITKMPLPAFTEICCQRCGRRQHFLGS